MSRPPEQELGQFIPLHYHYQMLADTDRTEAFRQAIQLKVRPGDRVVDLGSGTGFLSFLAAQAGAQVQGIERLPALVAASRQFLANNGVAEQVQIVQADAHHWLPDEPVDLVVCEMLHSALLREHQLQVVSLFCQGHYQRFGYVPKLIPEYSLLAVQLVQQNYQFSGYQAAIPLFQSAYAQTDTLACTEPQLYQQLDYRQAPPDKFEARLEFELNHSHFNALRFITKNILAIAADPEPVCIDWHNQYLLLPLQPPAASGQRGLLSFEYRAGDSLEALQQAIAFRWLY